MWIWRVPFKNLPGAGASQPLLNAFKTTFPELAWQPTTFLLGNLVKNEDFYELSHLRLTKSKCLGEKSNYLYCLTNSILVESLNKPLCLLTSTSIEKQEKGLKILHWLLLRFTLKEVGYVCKSTLECWTPELEKQALSHRWCWTREPLTPGLQTSRKEEERLQAILSPWGRDRLTWANVPYFCFQNHNVGHFTSCWQAKGRVAG